MYVFLSMFLGHKSVKISNFQSGFIMWKTPGIVRDSIRFALFFQKKLLILAMNKPSQILLCDRTAIPTLLKVANL